MKRRYTKNYLPGEAEAYSYGIPEVIRFGGAKLRIGKFCSIAEKVVIILGGDHRLDWISTYPFPSMWEEAAGIKGYQAPGDDVTIENDVWIGREVLILPGITIGNGAVIGARSVVARDVPPYAIAVGNPARVIRHRFDERVIERLLKIQWWNWPEDKIIKNLPILCSGEVDRLSDA